MSIRKRKTKNGYTWQIDCSNATGERIRKSGFKTKADAEREYAKICLQVENGINVNKNKKIYFVDICDKFIKEHTEVYSKRSTIDNYNSYYNYQIKPFFKTLKLSEITPAVISKFIKQKQADNYAPKSINNFLTMIKSVMNFAVNNGYLNKNPIETVKKLKLPHHEMDYLRTDEIKIVLKTAQEFYPKFYPLLLTAIMTGMRRGELLALQWKDINFENKKITVNKSLYKGTIQTPKTQKSIRKINMPEILADTLFKLKKDDNSIVFPNANGNYKDGKNMVNREFHPCLEKAGLRKIRFHDLRHTFASFLISQNMPLKYIQAQMGHTSIQTTSDKYGHLMPEVEQVGRSAFDSIKI